MKIVIVDTNIIFSAILNAKSRIGEILFNNNEQLEFYSSDYLREEIERHRNKILEIAKTSEEQVNEVIFQLYKRINFISDQQIPYQNWAESVPMVRDIDMDDLPFVALTSYLEGLLWTGDIKLLTGLRAKGFQRCITTEDLFALLSSSWNVACWGSAHKLLSFFMNLCLKTGTNPIRFTFVTRLPAQKNAHTKQTWLND